MTIPFKKHPTNPDVWVRHLTKEQLEEERRQEAQEEEDEIVRLSSRWLRPIPELEWKVIERIAESSWFGLGGEIVDVHFRREGTAEFNGRRYAVVWIRLYVKYLSSLLEEDLPEGTELVSDAIDVTIYRDPRKPRRLRLIEGHQQFQP